MNHKYSKHDEVIKYDRPNYSVMKGMKMVVKKTVRAAAIILLLM